MADKLPKITELELVGPVYVKSPWNPREKTMMVHRLSHQYFEKRLVIADLPGCDVGEPQNGLFPVYCYEARVFDVPVESVRSVTREWESKMSEIKASHAEMQALEAATAPKKS